VAAGEHQGARSHEDRLAGEDVLEVHGVVVNAVEANEGQDVDVVPA
jgi:hypothetical protein